MSRILLLIFPTLFIATHTAAQKVLNGTYIPHKEVIFGPRPTEFRWISDYELMGPPKEKVAAFKTLEKHFPLYKGSYLHVEPEYSYVRVMWLVKLSDNPHLSTSVPDLRYHFMPEEKVYTYRLDDENDSIAGYRKTVPKASIEYHPHRVVEQLIGLNINEIREAPGAFARIKERLSSADPALNAYLREGIMKVNGEGVLELDNQYCPPAFRMAPIVRILTDGVLDGAITIFSDIDFNGPFTIEEAEGLLDGSEIKVSAIRIKEDYHIDPLTGELTSSIIGLGLVGPDQTPGEELCWMYYPEVRYALEYAYTMLNNKYSKWKGKILNDAWLLDHHFYRADLEAYGYLSTNEKLLHPDLAFSVKLDPLIALKMYNDAALFYDHPEVKGRAKIAFATHVKRLVVHRKNGMPHGKVVQYHHNGQPSFQGRMNNGLCDGKFSFYYADGSPKAIRNYEDGRLEGEQLNYYPDGTLYAGYTIVDGDLITLKRQYPDGKLLEEGGFEHGVLSGTWSYRIACDSTVFNILQNHCQGFADRPFQYHDNGFSFKVKYQQEFGENCLPLYDRYPLERLCLSSEYVE